MKKASRLLTLTLLLLSHSVAYSVAPGPDTKILSGIWAEAKANVAIAKETLESAKIANDYVKNTAKTVGDLRDEYYFIKNFDLEREIDNIVEEFADLTYIDDFSDAKTLDDKLRLLRGEVDKRFENEKREKRVGESSASRKILDKRLKAIEALRKLQKEYRDNSIKPKGKTTADVQSSISSATSTLAMIAIDEDIEKKKNIILRHEKTLDEVQWEIEFQQYLSGKVKPNSSVEKDTGLWSNVVSFFLDANSIYAIMGSFTLISTLGLWLVALFMGVRLFQEGIRSMTGKAAVAQAVLGLNKTMMLYLAYSIAGLAMFGLIFTANSIFQYFGDVNYIHEELGIVRADMLSSEKHYADLVEQLMSYAGNVGNVLTAPIAWSAYQMVAIAYVPLEKFIDVLFAVGFALVYLWGYVAIGTTAMAGALDISKGWLTSFMVMFAWAIIDPILMGLAYALTAAGGAKMTVAYTGLSTTVAMMYYVFATMVLVLIIIFKIMAPLLASKLVANQNIGSVLGGAAALPAAVVMNQILSKIGGKGGAMNKMFGQLGPDMDNGVGFRDQQFQSLRDRGNTSVTDAARAMREGLGNIINRNNPGP